MRKARSLTLFALALGLGLALVALPGPAPAGAGGWAITSLDPMATPVPGEPIEVGFTVLQHGRTPVDATAPGMEGAEYGFVVTAPDGRVTEFPARPDGAPGHFVGEVTFPTAGTYTWTVRPGYFAPLDLGELVVEPPSGAAEPAAPVATVPAPADEGRASPALRLGLPALAVAALARLTIDIVVAARGGRRPGPAAA